MASAKERCWQRSGSTDTKRLFLPLPDSDVLPAEAEKSERGERLQHDGEDSEKLGKRNSERLERILRLIKVLCFASAVWPSCLAAC